MNALLIIDVQNDFMPNGALPVTNGDKIIPFINSIIHNYSLVVATQDWHPKNHKSFVTEHPDKKLFDVINLNGIKQVLWPPHCIQRSKGAAFHPDLDTRPIQTIFRKGMDINVDSYSAFYDNNKQNSTRLTEYFKAKKITSIDVVGLAADYCVRYSIEDALRENFKVNLLLKGTRAINDKDFEKILNTLNQNKNFKALE